MHDADEDSNWRDDMLVEVLHAVVSRAISAAAREEIDLPHLVVCCDTRTGAVSYSGPFEDGVAALVVADRESRRDEETNDGAPMVFTVAALLPTTGLSEAG